MRHPAPATFIRLTTDAFANGRVIGRAGGFFLRRRIAAALAIRRRQKIPATLIAARVRDFRRHVERLAPHWLVEAGGIARGAGVAAEHLLMLNCLPPGFYPAQPLHCTTFLAVGQTENRLFKIRDERNHIQAFYVHVLPSGRTFQVGHDIGNLGVAHFFNSNAVAGANNTGSHTALVPDEPRLNDCHILRYFAEHANSVNDIPDLYARLIGHKAAGGAGPGRGAIYILVDAHRGLLLETQSEDYVARFLDRGRLVVANHFLSARARQWMSQPPNANTLTRKARMEALLARAGRRPALPDIFALSRDRKHRPHALCNDDRDHFWMTISAQLQVIPRRAPMQAVNYICCGNTRQSVYLPVPLTFRESYQPLLGGRFYAQADRLYRAAGGRWIMKSKQAAFEKDMLAGMECREAMTRAFMLLRKTAADRRAQPAADDTFARMKGVPA